MLTPTIEKDIMAFFRNVSAGNTSKYNNVRLCPPMNSKTTHTECLLTAKNRAFPPAVFAKAGLELRM